jgi:hypothetical protein
MDFIVSCIGLFAKVLFGAGFVSIIFAIIFGIIYLGWNWAHKP